MEEYADSSFQEMLYGPNSTLDPDNFIQTVLQTIGSHKDLTKEVRKFLPDDIDEEEESMGQRYRQFKDNAAAARNGDLFDADS